MRARLFAPLFFSALALSAAPSAFAQSAGQQCRDNFKIQGSFFTPRSFRSHAMIKAAPDRVFQRAYTNVVRQGFAIDRHDKEARVLVALNEVAGSHRQIPLNVVVDEDGEGGSRLSLVFSLDAGMAVGKEDVIGGLCEIMEAAEG